MCTIYVREGSSRNYFQFGLGKSNGVSVTHMIYIQEGDVNEIERVGKELIKFYCQCPSASPTTDVCPPDLAITYYPGHWYTDESGRLTFETGELRPARISTEPTVIYDTPMVEIFLDEAAMEDAPERAPEVAIPWSSDPTVAVGARVPTPNSGAERRPAIGVDEDWDITWSTATTDF